MRLLIASRPDDSLTDLEAALVKLEPLSEDAAVQYICQHGRDQDSVWVRHLVGVAEVVEMPFYLKLARDLSELDRLGLLLTELAPPSTEEVKPGASEEAAALERLIEEHGNRARLVLRLGLLDKWAECLAAASLCPRLALSPAARERAIEGLRQMAASALLEKDLDFHFERARDLGVPVAELEIASRHGEDLEVVERVGDVVRFQHSIMQAYLGSERLLARLDGDMKRLGKLLEEQSTRELLMALVMGCFRATDELRKSVRDQLKHVATDPASSGPVDFEMLAAAYEIDGMVARDAIHALSSDVTTVWDKNGTFPRSEGAMAPFGESKLQEAKLRVVDQIGKVRRTLSYEVLWHICENEDSYVVRLHAAQALATGGSEAFEVLEPQFERARARGEALLEQPGGGEAAAVGDVRLLSLQGWILPMLAATCAPAEAEAVRTHLGKWAALIPRVHLGAEACLAQGLKYEANRTPKREVDPSTRPFLVEQAISLLERDCWWYSEISLLHALCLWSLDPQFEGRQEELRAPIRKRRAEGYHPFVREAAALCSDVGGDPSHSVWIDETGTVAQVGPAADVFGGESAIGLRIPPAAGWFRLQPHAQQLLGELFLMLNLIERGSFDGREERRRKTRLPADANGAHTVRQVLPYCLTNPTERRERFAIGDRIVHPAPGAKCPNSALCKSQLCPYPGPDERPFRGELSEAFCRRQQSLLRRYRRPPAAWRYQTGRWRSLTRRSELREFWRTLERRGRV
jgi:hypothetical protein